MRVDALDGRGGESCEICEKFNNLPHFGASAKREPPKTKKSPETSATPTGASIGHMESKSSESNRQSRYVIGRLQENDSYKFDEIWHEPSSRDAPLARTLYFEHKILVTSQNPRWRPKPRYSN